MADLIMNVRRGELRLDRHTLRGWVYSPSTARALIRAARRHGGELKLSGEVAGDLDLTGQVPSIVVSPGSKVDGHLRVSGDVAGDLQVWGEVVGDLDVVEGGRVSGDLFVWGGEVGGDLRVWGGEVGGDLEVRGGGKVRENLVVVGEVAGNLKVFGEVAGYVYIQPGSRVGGDLDVVGEVKGSIFVAGEVAGDVDVSDEGTVAGDVVGSGKVGGNLTVAGEIKGDLLIWAQVAGNLEVSPAGKVAGSLQVAGEGKVARDLIVSGQVDSCRFKGGIGGRTVLSPSASPSGTSMLLLSVRGGRFGDEVFVGDRVDISRADFRQCPDLDRLLLVGSSLFPRGVGALANPPADAPDKLPALEMASIYRQLRTNLETRRNRAAAGIFYRGEMESRRQAARQQRRWTEWAILSLYKGMSGYGLVASRAFGWFLGLVLIGAGLYHFTAAGFHFDPYNGKDSLDLFGAVQFSLESVLGLLRAPGDNLQFWESWLQIAQRIIGPVLLAQAVLAIREPVAR